MTPSTDTLNALPFIGQQTGQIAFLSLCNIAIALNCEGDFDTLFSQRQYNSIQEVIDAQQQARKQRAT